MCPEARESARVVPRPLFTPPEQARQLAVRMRDGVLLATDVYLPPAGHGPVLLSRLPYDKAGDECFMPAVARWLCARGYVVVVQDVRGKGRSGGELAPFVHEVDDGYDTLEWITGQDWASGPIGMFGDSYYGYTQWAAAASGHPALAAMAPRVTTPDAPRLLTDGVFRLEMAVAWVLETFLDERLFDCIGTIDWTVRPLADIAAEVLDGIRPHLLDRWVGGAVDAPEIEAEGRIPTLHLVGLDDFLAGAGIDAWRRASEGPAEQLLLVDARDHGWTARDPGVPGGAASADGDPSPAFLEEYLSPLLGFFDRHLGQSLDLDSRRRSATEIPPVRWRIGDDRFHAARTWPPPDVVRRQWTLTVDGLEPAGSAVGRGRSAEDDPAGRPPVRSFVHDPSDPVPSAANPFHPNLDRGDDTDSLDRDDVLVFASTAVTQPLVLLGSGTVSVDLDIDGDFDIVAEEGTHVVGHLMVGLFDVAPDGRAARIAEAAVAVVDIGQPTAVDLPALGWEVSAGHRLALRLSASSYPGRLLHPGSAEDPWTATAGARRTYRVRLGEKSRLSLDVRGESR